MLACNPLTVPDVLGSASHAVESFLALLPGAVVRGLTELDLSHVTWVRPFGAATLLLSCRYLAEHIGSAVRLTRLRANVHAYLRRIDFFDSSDGCAYTRDRLAPAEEFSRGVASPNVLELLPIRTTADVDWSVARGRRIMEQWLDAGSHAIGKIITLLSEACGNVAAHSNALGYVTIQKYVRRSHVDVELAITDLGCGIRGSLVQTHGTVAHTCSGYIQRVVDGLSAHGIGESGLGLHTMRRITTASGGSLFIRSETGSLRAHGDSTMTRDGLSPFPGTQLSLVFRSQLPAAPCVRPCFLLC
jgi:anti-sigma regulatory factor (Ser/Thr protein kinase)